MFSYPWHWLHVFPHMTRLTCFLKLGTSYMFPHTWLALHIFLYLTLITCFPTRLTLHVFLSLALVTCFPTHDPPYMFTYAWHWLHVFPHMTPLTCFPMLGTQVTCFPTDDLAHIFPHIHLALVIRMFFHCLALKQSPSLSRLSTNVIGFAAGHMFSQAWQHLLQFFGFAWIDSLCKLLFFLW